MGSADDATSSAGGAMSSARRRGYPTHRAGSPAGAGQPGGRRPDRVRCRDVVGLAVPGVSTEGQAAAAIKDQAQPLVDEATSAAKEIAGNLQEPAQQALESVKSTATDAVDTVKEEAAASADDVKGQAQDAKDAVSEHATSD